MSEEEINDVTASEEQVIEAEGQEQVQQDEPRKVPLSALEAERHKRQEAEAKRQDLEAQNRLYADYIERMKSEKILPQDEDPEEDSELIDRKSFKREQQAAKREIREEIFVEMNPKAIDQIKQYLNPILEKKPWLRDSIKGSDNRYARAYEIVQDYQHLVDPKTNFKTGNEGARIVQNANKPGSPVTVAKASPTSNMAMLKNMQGKAEFREYRQKVLRGEL